MSDATSRHHRVNARRGLATVAFLKARFDVGTDHLGLFQPFVDDALLQTETDAIELSSLKDAIRNSTGLSIPIEIIKTLLKRAKKKGLVTRAGGRYLRTQGHTKTDFRSQMHKLEQATERLVARFRQFAAARGQRWESDDDTVAALIHFLDSHHIGVVLGQPIRASSVTGRLNHTVAAFVAEIVEEAGPDSAILESIVKGIIVQNALLLRDVPIDGRHLSALTVYVDSGVLLRALGYAGSAELHATTEALALLRAAGARLRAFDDTVTEIESILRVYERKLGSSAGIKSLRPTPLTHNFLTAKTTPTEVRQEIALITRNLQRLGVRVHPFPRHKAEYTEDEKALAGLLRDRSRQYDEDERRVWHDVMAIAAILTLREGARPSRMSNAKHVFASGSARTVMNAARWYRRSYSHGLEPIVHFRSVTNAAWVLRPTDAANVPMHELAAVCAAVLQPSTEVWSRFVEHLDKMVATGELSDDESIAVVANEFTRMKLSDFGPDEDVEATTVREIVERVRAAEQTEFTSQLDQERRKRNESDRAVVIARSEIAQLKEMARAQADRIATAVTAGIYGGILIILASGAVWTLPTEWSNSTRGNELWGTVWWVCVSGFVVCSILGFTDRFHVLNLYGWLKGWLTMRVQRILLPEEQRGDRIVDI